MKIPATKTLALIFTVLLLALFACEKADPNANLELDIEQLARDLYENGKFVDQLERLDDAAVPYAYNLGSPVKAVVYAGSAATPEEIIVAEYENEESASAGYDKIKTRLADQRKTFDNYNAEYRPLLDDPLFVKLGKYVIYCVSNDTNAAKAVFDRYTKG